jgi:hypothetical protein
MQLVPVISGGQPLSYNVGMAETFSWIPIANDQGRDLYARASYITNLSDLSVSISAGSFDIGSVHLMDSSNGLYASIADIGLTGLDFGKGAVRVLTQDLDSNVDDITIGDKNSNFASINAATSALNVFTVNGISAVTVNNLNTYISALTSTIATAANQVITNTILNALTAQGLTSNTLVTVNNTLLNALTASTATAVNQVNTNTILNALTAQTATEINLTTAGNTLLNALTSSNATAVNQVTTNTLLNALTSSNATAVNQVVTNTLLNSLTASDATLVTLSKTLTANSATQSNQVTTNSLLNSLTANNATAANQVTTNTLLNTLTANIATSTNQITTNTLLKSLTANNATGSNQVITNTLLNSVTANQATALNQTNTNTLLNSLTSNVATAANQVSTNTLLNSVTANQVTQTSLQQTLTANSVYGTSSSQPLYTSITNTLSTTPVGTQLVTFADSVQIDQASRLRVATPQTQWWYMATVDKDGDLRYNESFVAGASSIFVQNLASVNLTSGTTSVSGQVIRASRRRHKIIPGLSHEYTAVFNWDGQQANVVKRIGIFTQFNGYFFELSGTNMNAVVRRRLVDGSLVEERVNQYSWNGDKLDGTGPSGENWNALTQNGTINSWVSTTPISITNDGNVYNVVYTLSAGQVQNFRQGTKATITGVTPSGYNAVAMISNTDTVTNRLTASYLFNPGVSASNVSGATMVQNGYHMEHTYWIDFTGGRTNRVRFGKQSDYGKIVLHTFRFDGLLGTAYENAPTLTERKEVYNIGSVTSLPSFTVMGNAFNVEAQVDITPNFNVARNDTGIAFNTGEEFPILGLALRAGEPYQRADIQLQTINITDLANIDNNNNKAAFSWRVVLNPSIQGTLPSSTNIGKASRQWAYTTANSVSGGTDLIGGYGISQLSQSFPTSLNFINMGSNIDNTDSDKIVVVAKLLNKGTDNSSLVATMNFVEAL